MEVELQAAEEEVVVQNHVKEAVVVVVELEL